MEHVINHHHVHTVWRLLYYTYGLLPIVAGFDKFTNFLVSWPVYLHPDISEFLPMTPMQVMYGVGIVEIIAGLLVLMKPRFGGYVVALWLVVLAFNLIGLGFYDIAVRDSALAIGAISLALLS